MKCYHCGKDDLMTFPFGLKKLCLECFDRVAKAQEPIHHKATVEPIRR